MATVFISKKSFLLQEMLVDSLSHIVIKRYSCSIFASLASNRVNLYLTSCIKNNFICKNETLF